MDKNAKITVSGIVQGVGFRWYVDRLARKYQLQGFVENLVDGKVFTEVEGEEGMIIEFIKNLRIGPRGASVDDVTVEWNSPHNLFTNFKIKA
ncbi:MAG: acylphosphatase [Bacteroidetes bacterium]|nr:acylphosphatase [Bacteroidota bacterium]